MVYLSRSLLVLFIMAICGLAVCKAWSQPATAGAGTYLIERAAPTHSGPVVVACVGDSITAGSHATSAANKYPALLGDLFGPGYKVLNFGESGATLLKIADKPYWSLRSFGASLASSPDVVVIMLGTNDSKPQNWRLKDEFAADYASLIETYAQLPSHPQIFVALPPPVMGAGNYGINSPGVEDELPIITQVAAQKRVTLIDAHSCFVGDPADFVDRVHPNDAGYNKLAGAIYIGLTNAPVIEPITERLNDGYTTVTIIPPFDNVTVRYTVDGTEPSERSPIYRAPFKFHAMAETGGETERLDVVVKARAYRAGKAVGLVSTAAFPSANIVTVN
jgi:lysophospholipase L1-like esterase